MPRCVPRSLFGVLKAYWSKLIQFFCVDAFGKTYGCRKLQKEENGIVFLEIYELGVASFFKTITLLSTDLFIVGTHDKVN